MVVICASMSRYFFCPKVELRKLQHKPGTWCSRHTCIHVHLHPVVAKRFFLASNFNHGLVHVKSVFQILFLVIRKLIINIIRSGVLFSVLQKVFALCVHAGRRSNFHYSVLADQIAMDRQKHTDTVSAGMVVMYPDKAGYLHIHRLILVYEGYWNNGRAYYTKIFD